MEREEQVLTKHLCRKSSRF